MGNNILIYDKIFKLAKENLSDLLLLNSNDGRCYMFEIIYSNNDFFNELDKNNIGWFIKNQKLYIYKGDDQ